MTVWSTLYSPFTRVFLFTTDLLLHIAPCGLTRHRRGGRSGPPGEVVQWLLLLWSSTCFNPYPVLRALKEGAITEQKMAAASGSNWRGLKPSSLVQSLATDLQRGKWMPAKRPLIADFERQHVQAVPLLLHVGLLSTVPGQPTICRPPNEYAVASLRTMLLNAMSEG